jgi:DNA ligase-associated metallophosphoesterase
MTEFEWGGHRWHARPDRTLYWPATKTLILADPHFGKAQHFRGAGIPVPAGTTRRNLEVIDAALADTGAERLVVLGDFFHAHLGVTPGLIDQLRAWRDAHPSLEIVNIRGNHDRHAGDPPESLRIACRSHPGPDTLDATVAFAHEPREHAAAVTLCGHVHPGVRLDGPAKSRMRVACFHVTEKVAVLPAFGAFTGMKVIEPRRGDRVFAVGPDAVVEVSETPKRQAS